MENKMTEAGDKKDLNERELLEAILEENKRRTFYSKITAVSTTGIFAVVVICILVLLPRVNGLINNAEEAVTAAKITLAQTENAAAGLAQMSQDVMQTSEDMSTFVAENSTAISDAVTNISSIDYENLNKAIQDLKDTVEPLANFMNRFK